MMILYFPPDVVSHSLSLRPALLRGHAPRRRDDARLGSGSLPILPQLSFRLRKKHATSIYSTKFVFSVIVARVFNEDFRFINQMFIKCLSTLDEQVLGRYNGAVMLRKILWCF